MQTEFLFSSPPFQSCHAPSLAQTSNGLVAAWFGGSREGATDVGIWLSRKESGAWTMPVQVAAGEDSAKRFPCWNPVLHPEPNGPLLLFYKVGPSPDRWWGMLVRSEDCGLTWSRSLRLPDGILGPVKNKPLRLANGLLLCPSSSEHDGWRAHLEWTQDLGKTWASARIPGELQAIQPALLQHPGGRLQVLCRSTSGWILTSWSGDRGRTWSVLEKTVLPNPNSGIDAITLADGRHLVVYNQAGMLPGQWGGPRTPLNLAVSPDGLNWQPGAMLEDEHGEFSYPAVIQAGDKRIHILYTWRRQNIRHAWLEPSELEG
jgi:predicted neuraminidase